MKSFMERIKDIFGTGYESAPEVNDRKKETDKSSFNPDFLSLAKKRRSIYKLGSKITLSQYEIGKIVESAVKHAPSAFNSQSSRVVILFSKDHAILWSMTREKLRKLVPPEEFESTAERINSFANAAGSILFFEDQVTVKNLQEQYPSYSDSFPAWSEQSSGMAQYAVWMALTEKGIGANLQHYNPLIDEEVHSGWNVPLSWKLRAQMNFGVILKYPEEKDYMLDSQRFIIPGRN